MRTASSTAARRQGGMAMFIALTMLLLITVIGLAVASTQTVEERMASNTQNHNIALQAAEAGLRYAEAGLLSGLYSQFPGNTNGLYYLDPTNVSATPQYMAISWTASSNGGSWPAAGTSSAAGVVASSGNTLIYNGPSLASNNSSKPPEFIIEQLPSYCRPGQNCASGGGYGANTGATPVYRVTSYGFGGDANSSAMVQSIVHP